VLIDSFLIDLFLINLFLINLLGLIDVVVLFQSLVFQTSLNINKEFIDESDCLIVSIIASYFTDFLDQNETIHKLIPYIVSIMNKVRINSSSMKVCKISIFQ
jgi:hypothetical protein